MAGVVADHAKKLRYLTDSLDEGDRLLLGFLRDGTISLSVRNCEAVYARAVRHGVAPWLYHRLTRSGLSVPDSFRSALQQEFLRTSAFNGALLHHLAKVLAGLRSAEIPVIVLKGAHLASVYYESPSLRPMCDVDLLVRPEDLAGTQKVILQAGYAPKEGSLPVDLHWDISSEHKEIRPDMTGAWERSEPAVIAGVNTRTLSAEDLIVHLATHFAFEHLFEACGLRPLVDFKEISRSGAPIDWKRTIKIAEQWGNGGGAYLSLLLARELAGAAIPQWVIERLRPPALDTATVAWASRQIFTDRPPEEECCYSPYFWRIWKKGALKDKGHNLSTLLLPPRERISQEYPVAVSAPVNLFYRLKRLGDHARSYGGLTLKMIFREKKTLARAERENRNMDMRGKLLSP